MLPRGKALVSVGHPEFDAAITLPGLNCTIGVQANLSSQPRTSGDLPLSPALLEMLREYWQWKPRIYLFPSSIG